MAQKETFVRWEKFLPQRFLKVLLVEFDDSTRHVLSALLRNCSYEVIAAGDGMQAWELLEDPSNHFDFVLAEVDMPSLSGIQLLSNIRRHKTCSKVPVIMMSAHDSMNTVLECISEGAVDFLLKPLRKNELRNLWQHVWRKYRSLRYSSRQDKDQVRMCLNNDTTDSIANGVIIDNEKASYFDLNIHVSRDYGIDAKSVMEYGPLHCTLDPKEFKCVDSKKECNQQLVRPIHSIDNLECTNAQIKGSRQPMETLNEKLDTKNKEYRGKKEAVLSLITYKGNQPKASTIEPESKAMLDLFLNAQDVNEEEDDNFIKSSISRQDEPSSFSRYNMSEQHLWGTTSDVTLDRQSSSITKKEHYILPSGRFGSSAHVISSEMAGSAQEISTDAPVIERSQNKDFGSSVIYSALRETNSFSVPGKTAAAVPISLHVMKRPMTMHTGSSTIDAVNHPALGPAMYSSYPGTCLWSFFVPQNVGNENTHGDSSHLEKYTLPHSAVCGFQLNYPNYYFHHNLLQDHFYQSNKAPQHASYFRNESGNLHQGNHEGTFAVVEDIECGNKKCESRKVQTQVPDSGRGDGVSRMDSNHRETALTKFRQKRNLRCFDKKVRYQARKALAEQRPRIKGCSYIVYSFKKVVSLSCFTCDLPALQTSEALICLCFPSSGLLDIALNIQRTDKMI